MRCNGPPASAITDVPKFELMDPYESNTSGLLQLLSNYGTTTTSTDLLNLLAGWPGPGSPNPNGPVPNPNYDPSTQQDIQQDPSMGGGTPPPPMPVDLGGNAQQPATVGTQAPGANTQGGQGQGAQGQGGNTPPPQQQGTSLSINPLQIVGILGVVIAIYLVTKKR